MIAYLDIETSFSGEVTVVGVLRPDRGTVQLVAPAVSADHISEVLSGVDTICTYNGEQFDLPVLGRATGLDMLRDYRSEDLVLQCRRANLRGGLKAIESTLGIPRVWHGLSGYDAMLLWDRWTNGSREALETLLGYNRDDVLNLALLERRLKGDLGTVLPDHLSVVGV
ncbi:MAG TPA: ribonuclease H-like domain-containing protein [Actinomycetota bacterium]|nr:ribonuclease H-like domain-containing protein [Actinomycetota bacterium]